jgi:tetratricopeptide (TPR) repeat protein
MDKKHSMVQLVACGIIIVSAGCATDMARVDYNNRVQTAFGQLQQGEPLPALDNLQAARKIGQENDYDQTEIKHLLVETHLSLGNNTEAHNQAKTLLDTDPQDAYANELMGKVLLKDGQYSEAEKCFVRAEKVYQAEVDISRARDLVALSRYFSAYEQGNPRLAERYLREIQNPDLQHAVEEAEEDMLVKGH